MDTELQNLVDRSNILVKSRLNASLTQITEFCHRWKIIEFALFGSVLRDDFRPDSDIDVLVTFSLDALLSLFDLVEIQDELEELFQRNVDVVLKESIQASANYLRRHRILASAKTIYSIKSYNTAEQFNIELESSGRFTSMDRDQSLLPDIVLAGRKIQNYVSDVNREMFQQSTLIQDASVRQLEIIGEAARRLSQTMKDSQPDISWSAIIGMRNRLIHEYTRVDVAIVWDVICNELPNLIARIEPLIPTS